MAGQIALVVFIVSTAFVSLKLVKWYKNYQLAQQCGLPVYLSPVHFSDPLWMFLGPLFVPLIKLLPDAWTKPWLSISQMFEIWKAGHLPFDEAGSDTFVLATPNGNIMWTSDGEIIHQLLLDHPRCQMATDLVEFFKICGPNIGVTEGDEWKLYRRIVTSGLGSSINSRAWHESQEQTEGMVQNWIQNEGGLIKGMGDWTSKLALHVLAHGFFDIKMTWTDSDNKKPQQALGHSLSFDKALSTTIQQLPIILMTPQWLLNSLPFKVVQDAATGFKETNSYLDEMRDRANSQVESLVDKKNKTLLEAIVVAGADSSITGKSALPKESVKGNLFFTLVAGHHTLGSIMSFIFIFLAVYPDAQQRLQAQLDQHFGKKPKKDWTVEEDFKQLQSGYLGAIQKEVSAMYHPVQFIPRIAAETLTIRDGSDKSHVIPAGTLTMINMPAAARNPRNWSKQSRDDDLNADQRGQLSHSPALYFNPERWLVQSENGVADKINAEDCDSTTWFTFSQGARACPGRTFAQIEMTAVMATFFKDYSLELVANDKIISQCNGDMDLAQQKTRENAIKMLYDDIEFLMGLKLKHDLPIKVKARTPA